MYDLVQWIPVLVERDSWNCVPYRQRTLQGKELLYHRHHLAENTPPALEIIIFYGLEIHSNHIKQKQRMSRWYFSS